MTEAEEANGWLANPFLVYSLASVLVLVALMALIIGFDLCWRWLELGTSQISDGGPPTSPGHPGYRYSIVIKAQETVGPFDHRQTMLRVEFLDINHQYLTSVTVPCFLFKFKHLPSSQSPAQVAPEPKPSSVYKSMTHIQDMWARTSRGEQISFSLTKRLPMRALAYVRLTHDCYLPEAHLKLEHIIIRDEVAKMAARVELRDRRLRSLHPCPASGEQIFPLEQMA